MKKTLRELLRESIDDIYVGTELATKRGMGEDRADVIMSEFDKHAGLSIKQKYWKLTKAKKYKPAADLVYKWNKIR